MNKPTESQINLIKSWRDDPQWSDNIHHVTRWDQVLAIWGENEQDVTPFSIDDIEHYADRGWGRWQTVLNLVNSLKEDEEGTLEENPELVVSNLPLQSINKEIVKKEKDEAIDTSFNRAQDPRGKNDPWRFLTEEEQLDIKNSIEECYDDGDNELALNFTKILEETPPQDYFSPSFVYCIAENQGDGLIARAIKFAQEGKEWDEYWISQAADRYGLQDEVLKQQYNDAIKKKQDALDRQTKLDEAYQVAEPDWDSSIPYDIETPIYPKIESGTWKGWDKRLDGNITYKNGVSNTEKNSILIKLSTILYPEDFDRKTLVETAPVEAKKLYYKLLRFGGDDETAKLIFFSHLLRGIRRDKGYSIIGLLPARQTWEVDGELTDWARDQNELLDSYLVNRRREIQRVRDGEIKEAAFVLVTRLNSAIEKAVKENRYEEVTHFGQQLLDAKQRIIDFGLEPPKGSIEHHHFITNYTYNEKGQRI